MRKLLAAAACALALAGGAARAGDHGTIRLTVGPGQYTGTGGGGEFKVLSYTDGEDLPPFGPLANDPGGVFQTFCLESNENIAFSTTYAWTLDTVVVKGGFGGGSPDPLDARTAYLYTKFWDGTLAGYVYAQGPGRAASATSLQLAMWKIEDELQSAELAAYNADAQAQAFFAAADAAVAGGAWSGLHDVRVLNLTDMSSGADVQSVLVRAVGCRLELDGWVHLGGGETIDFCVEDFDRDGLPDLLNITPETAQIFHNDGVINGVLHFTLVQEFPLDHGRRGCCLDIDDDGDCDLVLGDADYLVVAKNDGTGHFSPYWAYEHHFGVSTIAMPFDSLTNPADPDNRHRVLLVGTSVVIDPTALGVPDFQSWGVVLEFGPGGTGPFPIQLLDPIAADDVLPRDLDADGDVDLVISNRSGMGDWPLEIYESLAADMPGGLYVHAPPLDFLGAAYNFGYGVSIARDGSLAVGSWHRTYVLRRDASYTAPRILQNPSRAWFPAFDVPIDPLHAWQSAEVYAVGWGDFDCDGHDDLAMQGWHTPLVLVSMVDGVETGRFVAPRTPGIARDMAVLDWDHDSAHALDVIVGGTGGLFYYRNGNAGAAGPAPTPPTPPAPAPAAPDCSEDVYRAMRDLEALVAPNAVPRLAEPAAREHVAYALAELHSIDPSYLVAGVFALPTPPLDQIQTIFTRLQTAHAKLVAALARPGLPTVTRAALTATADRLVGASACLAAQAISMGGMAPHSVTAKRLLRKADADFADAASARARSTAEARPGKAGRLARRAFAANFRAYRRAVAAWRALRPSGS
jgi:hypothetical protein